MECDVLGLLVFFLLRIRGFVVVVLVLCFCLMVCGVCSGFGAFGSYLFSSWFCVCVCSFCAFHSANKCPPGWQ